MTTSAKGKRRLGAREVHEEAVRLQEEHAAHERKLGNEAGARHAEDLADRARLRRLAERGSHA
jgi:hypothetical protein